MNNEELEKMISRIELTLAHIKNELLFNRREIDNESKPNIYDELPTDDELNKAEEKELNEFITKMKLASYIPLDKLTEYAEHHEY